MEIKIWDLWDKLDQIWDKIWDLWDLWILWDELTPCNIYEICQILVILKLQHKSIRSFGYFCPCQALQSILKFYVKNTPAMQWILFGCDPMKSI